MTHASISIASPSAIVAKVYQKGQGMGERGWGSKASRNKNLKELHNQELKEPTTESKRSYD
jgi:hypothetical protein